MGTTAQSAVYTLTNGDLQKTAKMSIFAKYEYPKNKLYVNSRIPMNNQFKLSHLLITAGGLVILIAILLFGVPIYKVWQQEMTGKAELSRAEQNRQIRIQEAKAKKEAAVFEAEAEVERAKGVAAANKIIGESLNENENYLRYLWIQSLNDGNSETIYVPTEANLPILEADRFSLKPKKGETK